MRYGFLEHDDYQSDFRTYSITPGMAVMLPVLNYAGSVAVTIGMTIVWKCFISGGYFSFQLFIWLPEKWQYLRKYVYGCLGFGFMIVFALGFFTSLYYLFFLAFLLLYWSMMFKYGRISK